MVQLITVLTLVVQLQMQKLYIHLTLLAQVQSLKVRKFYSIITLQPENGLVLQTHLQSCFLVNAQSIQLLTSNFKKF